MCNIKHKWSFLITAAGSGSRLGGMPKQFRLLSGIPVWQWAYNVAERLRKSGEIFDIVLVVPSDYKEKTLEETRNFQNFSVVCGGAERSISVLNGLQQCKGEYVLVHDGARPFVSPELCRRIIAEAEDKSAAIPLVSISDSLKKITPQSTEAVDRSLFFRTQTPQAFAREKLISALNASSSCTDEASAWLAAGFAMGTVCGEEKNFKITTQYDWDIAMLMAGNIKKIHTGTGYDIHQLAENRKLIIAGIEIPNNNIGLLGHSDADVVTHAVMDAVLGAAGEPDIGTLFPASEERYRDANSISLLHSVLARVREKGWNIEWIDAVLIAQTPRMGHLIPEFTANLNRELGADVFNMRVKSAEHCGSAGRKECMICHASATLSKIEF